MVNFNAQIRRQTSLEDLYGIAKILNVEANKILLEYKDQKLYYQTTEKKT